MIPRVAVQAVVLVTIVVFGIGLFAIGEDPQPKWFRFFGFAVTASVILLSAFDRFLWKLGVIQATNKVPRDISGTWRGTLASHWHDPATGKGIPAKPAILVVRQTASTVRVTLMTDESRSRSSLGRVVAGDDPELVYMYLNKPEMAVEHRSRIHHGSTSLSVSGSPPTRLKGTYWTDRDSKGELDFDKRKMLFADDYDDGMALFN